MKPIYNAPAENPTTAQTQSDSTGRWIREIAPAGSIDFFNRLSVCHGIHSGLGRGWSAEPLELLGVDVVEPASARSLHGHDAVELGVPGSPDDTECALADFFDQLKVPMVSHGDWPRFSAATLNLPEQCGQRMSHSGRLASR